MEKSGLGVKILIEIESLIYRSCEQDKVSEAYRRLHREIVKKHFGAIDAVFDYQEKFVSLVREYELDGSEMDDESCFTQIIHSNVRYENLVNFLMSCLGSDTESLAFYMRILREFGANELPLVAV